jgi:hypothetical protein
MKTVNRKTMVLDEEEQKTKVDVFCKLVEDSIHPKEITPDGEEVHWFKLGKVKIVKHKV